METVRTGYLEKQGALRTNFKKRYFKLYASDAKLEYFSNQRKAKSKPKGTIDLTDAFNVIKDKSNARQFQILTKRREWKLRATTAFSRDSWFASIHAVWLQTHDELKHWLYATVQLPEYYGLLREHAFSSLQRLQSIHSKADLDEIGIKTAGHKIILLDMIRKLSASKPKRTDSDDDLEQHAESSSLSSGCFKCEGAQPGTELKESIDKCPDAHDHAVPKSPDSDAGFVFHRVRTCFCCNSAQMVR